MSSISLCMIVRNEEENIRRCLKSVYKYVDEIIIVDTGSTDETKNICKEFNAKIFDYEWKEDFADARNYSITKATNDLILILDADEELLVSDAIKFKKYIENPCIKANPIRMVHFYGEDPPDIKRSYVSSSLRLIHRHSDPSFTEKVHESLNISDVDYNSDTLNFMKILHYGYMQQATKLKCNRNLKILLNEKEKNPTNPHIHYHIAAEYYKLNKFIEAYTSINTSLIEFIKSGILPTSLAYKLKYDMLISRGYFESAYSGINKAIELYPDYVDLHFYKGVLQYHHKLYESAQETFSYCLVLGENNAKYLILSGVGSFYAMYYLGLCHEAQHQYSQAIEAYKQYSFALSFSAIWDNSHTS